jgi:hypothetical protein
MNTTHTLKRILAGALLSGGVAVTGSSLAAGTAQAFTYPPAVCNGQACSYVWCPGDPLPEPRYGPPNWDMNVCHHFMIGKMSPNSPDWATNGGNNRQVSPTLIEGDPGPCPGCVS